MNKILLTAFAIFCLATANGQGVTVQNPYPTSSIANKGSYIADSIVRIGVRGSLTKPSWWNPMWDFNGAIQIDATSGNFYWYSNNAWKTFVGGSADSVTFYTNYRADTSRANIYAAIAASGGTTDSAIFATQYRLDTVKANRVRYVDTSSMLLPYLRKVDTSSLSNRINLKLNITDTANIRLRPIAGANMTITGTYPNLTFASSGGGGGSADSVTFATNYRVDTAKSNLRASIALKLNISDTSLMLNPYLRKVDTTAMLSPYLRSVTAAATYAPISTTVTTNTTQSITGVKTLTTPKVVSLSSGSTNDSLLVADPSTGEVKRISSSRIAGGSSGWGLTGNSGTTAGTNYIGTNDAQPLYVQAGAGAGGGLKLVIPKAYSTFQPTLGLYDGASLVVNVGASSSLLYGMIMGADFNGVSYIQSQSFGGPTSYPLALQALGGSVIIGGTTPDVSARLDVSSTTKGFLPPRMTSTQVGAVATPSTGLMVYNTDAKMNLSYDGANYKSSGVVSGSFSQVAAATTTFTVTFGGTQPNTTYKVCVTPTGILTAAFFYITNKTTTTFDVTYLSGLTGTATFDWIISQ